MQQLLQCLLAQQHLSRTKAALGLLLNCTEGQPDAQQQPPTPASAARPLPAAAAAEMHHSSSSSRALQLVQDHLLAFLRPKDLASDELQLPLLAALGQAAQGGSWGAAVQPLAALLAACCPSTRCLDTLAGMMQVGAGRAGALLAVLKMAATDVLVCSSAALKSNQHDISCCCHQLLCLCCCLPEHPALV